MRRMCRTVRLLAGVALPVIVAAALSATSGAAGGDPSGAISLRSSVLPPLPQAAPVSPALSGAIVAPAPAAPESPGITAQEVGTETAFPAEQLAAVRRDAIVAARQVQARERTLAAIRHELGLLDADADAGRRGLAESRDEQAELLGAVLHLARNPPQSAANGLSLLDRLRAVALLREADSALRTKLHALREEITRLEVLKKRIASKKADEAVERQALATAQEGLSAAVAHRNALLRDMLPPQGIDVALRIADTEREAKNISELIKRTEAAEENSGKQPDRGRPAGSRNQQTPFPQDGDPTRPRSLRSLSQEAGPQDAQPSQSGGQQQNGTPLHPLLVPPVAGTIVPSGGQPGSPDTSSDGLSLDAVPGAAVVVPFDGKIVYAGPFRSFGRVLIIRHDHRYYSVLAGLGRIDAKLGDWVLAGEPVGAMPDIPSSRSGAGAQEPEEGAPDRLLFYELRRDGRPVDPQPWLASVGDGHDERNGEQKVSQ